MRRLSALVLLALPLGCLERVETVVVHEDGGTRLVTVLRGAPEDVNGGDAAPSREEGWQVEDRTETDVEGKQTLTRAASRDVAAGSPLPSSYAAAGSRAGQLGLRFPTTVTIERAEDGTYYHFRRAYPRRTWWAVEYLRQKAFETDEMKRILSLDPKALDDAERSVLVETLAGYAAEEMGTFLDMAAAELATPLPQRAFLDARRAGTAVYRDKHLAEQVVALLTRDAATDLGPIEREVRSRARDAVSVCLTDAGVSKEGVKSFLEAYERVRETHDLTKDLSDESWKVSVTLPGAIVAHNGEEAGDGGVVEWRFDGKAFFDRDLVLMATSFVPKGKK